MTGSSQAVEGGKIKGDMGTMRGMAGLDVNEMWTNNVLSLTHTMT